MKNLLKITLTLLIGIVISVGIFRPDMLMGTPASPAVGNWYQQTLPNINGASIRDILFIDSLNGFIVTSIGGSNSYILKTTNSGDNWTIKFNHTDPFVRVRFINNNTGFTNAFQTIFKTTNAGENWNPINLPGIFGDDMFVLNDSTIWLAMSSSISGGVYFTSNGGQNWVQQYSAGSQNPEKIYMYNARIGFISDNSGSSSIRKTTNGGLSWNLNLAGEYFFDMYFTDSLTGWKCMSSFEAADTSVKKTTNGGLNWIKQKLPTGGIILTSQIVNFSFMNKDTIWGTGGQAFYGGGIFRAINYRTTNGGNNWLFQIPDTSFGILGFGFIQFMNKNTGWVYATNRGIHTTNGGDTTFLLGLQQVSSEVPEDFKLYQNYPNPFNPKTNIKYSIISNVKGETSNVSLIVYDIIGREIEVLVIGEQGAGTYLIDWNASAYSSGIYFYKLTVTTGKEVFTDTKKMVLIK
ncbi:MAG TPA: YCF48-related protein [Ignavibacteria bacterium]|nr:YCF48-related protein [Ignavibacteria bacterium]